MSVRTLGFLLFVCLNSGVHATDDQKPTIGEKLDVIIKDVSEYLFWLFGYGEASIEEEIEASEILTDSFIKDVNEMIELMNKEAEKHIEHVKEIRNIEHDRDAKDSHEKVNKEKKDTRKEESSEDTSETEETEKHGYNIAVIPI